MRWRRRFVWHPSNRGQRQPIRPVPSQGQMSVVPGLFGPLRAGNIVFQHRSFGQGYCNTFALGSSAFLPGAWSRRKPGSSLDDREDGFATSRNWGEGIGGLSATARPGIVATCVRDVLRPRRRCQARCMGNQKPGMGGGTRRALRKLRRTRDGTMAIMSEPSSKRSETIWRVRNDEADAPR